MNNIQCSICNGSGLEKRETQICKLCSGRICILCHNNGGLAVTPYETCRSCHGSGICTNNTIFIKN